MRRNVAGLIVVFVGAAILQVAASDTYLRYVKPGMRPLLLIAGAILVLLAVVDVFADTKRTAAPDKEPAEHEAAETGHVHLGVIDVVDADQDHGHSHHRLPRAAWLLLLPVFALLVIDPPALGAAAAQRQSPVVAKPVTPAHKQGLLPSTGDPSKPVALPVRDYSVWAVWEKDSLQNRSFKLTGFVTPGKDGTWYVTRMGITCCVADGMAFMVEVRGQQQPPRNQWIEVTGGWAEPTKHPDGDIAAINGTAIRQVTAPANPYE